MSTSNQRNSIDKFLSKVISRKLFVFVVACIGLFCSKLTSPDWVIVASAYIGGQAFVDIVDKLKR